MLPRPTASCEGLSMPWCADLTCRHVARDQPLPPGCQDGTQSGPPSPLSLIAGSEHHLMLSATFDIIQQPILSREKHLPCLCTIN